MAGFGVTVGREVPHDLKKVRHMPKRFGSHNRAWIWGRHVVLETLRAGRWHPRELLISPRCAPPIRQEVERLARQAGLIVHELSDTQLTQRCRSEEHQGLAASLPPFPYDPFEQLLARRPMISTWLVLDRLQDSFNYGAVLRAAEGLGVGAILTGTVEQSEVNSQVVRSSAGAINYLSIAQVPRLVDAVQELKSVGYQLIAASEKARLALHEVDFRGPVAVIIGNEGQGVHPDLLAQCTISARIPLAGRVSSLNAAVAAGVVCYEIIRQRTLAGPADHRGVQVGSDDKD